MKFIMLHSQCFLEIVLINFCEARQWCHLMHAVLPEIAIEVDHPNESSWLRRGFLFVERHDAIYFFAWKLDAIRVYFFDPP